MSDTRRDGSPAPLPEPDEVIAGRFRVIEELGEGGMGAVYLAVQSPLGRDVALKVIHPRRTQKPQTRARFLREARVAARLDHPGVVKVIDFGEDERGRLFMAMELIRGPNLREKVDIDLPRLPLAEILDIARQIADVLVMTAREGIVHRDLKPENVHLVPTDHGPRVVLVDFGLAFIDEPDEEADGRQTREGVISGTPQYLSPEQAKGTTCGPMSDVYGFGIMLYEMLTREVPFDGDVGTLLARHIYMSPPKPREAFPECEIPGPLEDLVMAMLHKDPQDRPIPSRIRTILDEIDESAPPRHGARRSDLPRAGRAARMISVGGGRDTTPPPPLGAVVAWVAFGDDDDEEAATGGDPEFVTALGMQGLRFRRLTPHVLARLPEDVAVLVLTGARDEDVAQVRAQVDLPLFADAQAGDIQRLASLMRAGADEVLVGTVRPEELARKVARALRKRSRSS